MKTLLLFLAGIVLFTQIPAHAYNSHADLDKSQWSYDTDPYGSEAIINEKLIRHGAIWIKFKRVPRVDAKRNSWIELIHKLPSGSLAGKQKIRLTYFCEIPLLIKLSQQEYGKDGDKSYAHYQIELPATKKWSTQEVELADFNRPDWTPINSKDFGLLPEHINALYLTPRLTDKVGGEAILQVRAIELLP